MSALSKKPIPLSSGVTVQEVDGGFVIRGPQGEKSLTKLSGVDVILAPTELTVKLANQDRQSRMNEGTMWSLLRNAVLGTAQGFSKVLEIEGIGYKAAVEGSTVVLNLGFVNPVRVEIPAGITVTTEKKQIIVKGVDKELVGRVAAKIRSFKKPEPYKGKGIKYQGEVIRRKAGKKAASGE